VNSGQVYGILWLSIDNLPIHDDKICSRYGEEQKKYQKKLALMFILFFNVKNIRIILKN